jgi:hypothetical protein
MRGRREDDDAENHRRKTLEKGKEPKAKDADEEPLFNDTLFAVELLRSAFKKLEGVVKAFDIKARHDVYKDPSVKGMPSGSTGWLRSSRTSAWSSGLPAATSSSTTAATAATTATTAAATATTAGLRLIDRLLYQLQIIMSLCAFVSSSGSWT